MLIFFANPNERRLLKLPEYDPMFTMSALNMAIVSLYRITSSGDRIILDREYDNIINNLKIGEIKADRAIIDLYSAILKAIQKGRLRDEIRTEINKNESQKKQKSVKEILIGNVTRSFHVDPVQWLKKFISLSASEYFTQQKESQENAEGLIRNQDESLLRLKTEEIEEYNELQRQLLDSSWSLLSHYHLPDSYRLTQKLLTRFFEAMNESDPSKRLQKMKDISGGFAEYAPYWFYRAQSAIEAGRYDDAEKYFDEFERVWRPVLRVDPYRAGAMKFKIESLMRSGVTRENVGEILKCLEEMRENTEHEDWRNNLFAGMVYFSLGRKEEAERCMTRNILWDYEYDISSSVLDEMRNAELPQRFEPLIVVEAPKPEPIKIEPPKPKPPKPVQLQSEPLRFELPKLIRLKAQETPPPPKPKSKPMSDSAFVVLCNSGDALEIEKAIRNGANVNANVNPEPHGLFSKIVSFFSSSQKSSSQKFSHTTPLTCAAWRGLSGIIELLLRYGADINAKNNEDETALMIAATRGDTKVVKVLIKNGADINAANKYGNTALIMAAMNGNAEVAEVLIKYGADINAKNNEGNSALMWAVISRHAKVVEVLIENGAYINFANKYGNTALIMAAMNGNAEVAEVLIKHGANVNVALIEATIRKSDQAANFFLKLKADVKVAEIAKFLRVHGADVNAANNDGETALMIAAGIGNAEVAEVLLKHKADINAKNKYGETALMIAVMKDNTEVAEVFIENGADINAANNEGNSALMMAARDGHTETAELLLKHGADVNAKENDGETALMWAALKGHTKTAELLLKHGANVNAKDNNSRTALMWAAYHGKTEIAEVFIKCGADVNAKNDFGGTALTMAKRNNQKEVADLLRKNGAKGGFLDSLFG